MAKTDPWADIAEPDVAQSLAKSAADGERLKPAPRPWSTTDLGIAAYIHMKGVPIIGCKRDTKNRFSYEFDDVTEVCEIYQIEFINSCCRKFDAAVRNMKKLAHGGKPTGRR